MLFLRIRYVVNKIHLLAQFELLKKNYYKL